MHYVHDKWLCSRKVKATNEKEEKTEDIQAPRAAAPRTSVMLTRWPVSPETSGRDGATQTRRTITTVRSRSRGIFIVFR